MVIITEAVFQWILPCLTILQSILLYDNTSIDSDNDGTDDKDLLDGGNNNGSDSGAFLGNSLINTTFLDIVSIESDDNTNNIGSSRTMLAGADDDSGDNTNDNAGGSNARD